MLSAEETQTYWARAWGNERATDAELTDASRRVAATDCDAGAINMCLAAALGEGRLGLRQYRNGHLLPRTAPSWVALLAAWLRPAQAQLLAHESASAVLPAAEGWLDVSARWDPPRPYDEETHYDLVKALVEAGYPLSPFAELRAKVYMPSMARRGDPSRWFLVHMLLRCGLSSNDLYWAVYRSVGCGCGWLEDALAGHELDLAQLDGLIALRDAAPHRGWLVRQRARGIAGRWLPATVRLEREQEG